MDERKIILISSVCAIVCCTYTVRIWYNKHDGTDETVDQPKAFPEIHTKTQTQPNDIKVTEQSKSNVKSKVEPPKDACSTLEVFTQKPPKARRETTTKRKIQNRPEIETDNNTITAIGITVFLVILTLNAVLDVIKVKEEERARKKLNPDGERRQSLSEFAKRRPLRRDSSKFGLQLFQIAETVANSDDEKANRRQHRRYVRGDSTNSYLSERKPKLEGSAPASVGDTATGECRLAKRQSVAKLFGARPVPMVRRSSFPALPLNPDIQALMLGHRQPSFDSDDEGDGKGRRVRIIRRY